MPRKIKEKQKQVKNGANKYQCHLPQTLKCNNSQIKYERVRLAFQYKIMISVCYNLLMLYKSKTIK